MKKLFVLSLVALLAICLSVTAFATLFDQVPIVISSTTTNVSGSSTAAVGGISSNGYSENSDGVVIIDDGYFHNTVTPGGTLYVPLYNQGASSFVTVAESVKSVSIKASYVLGRDYVESIKIVYKRVEVGGNLAMVQFHNVPPFSSDDVLAPSSSVPYAYFLAITAKPSTSTSARDIAVDVNLKKSSGSLTSPAGNLAFETDLSLDLTCSYHRMWESLPTYQITKGTQIYYHNGDDGEQTFTFAEDPNTYFEVDVTGQERILLKANVDFKPAVAANFPAANLNFFEGTGTFNKIGTLWLYANPGSYLYVLNADGSLSKSKAAYDDAQDAFEIRTRTLGSYVISDRELDVSPVDEPPAIPDMEPQAPSAAAPIAPPTTSGEKPNPGTGAVA